MKKIEIKTKDKTYPIVIGKSVSENINDLINELGLYKNLFIVVDENVLKTHGNYLKKIFSKSRYKVNFFKLKPGESLKSLQGLSDIFTGLIKNKYGRDTLLVAIGGGVTGDLAGFAASVYMRGIQLANIPTTLLASVDSSIGGKTGINFNKYKNIIGAFHQPEFVLIDTHFLKSLPFEEINSGTGELVKYAFLTDRFFYNFININLNKIFTFEENVLEKIIYESVLFKGSVVANDEFESGLRKILNFGHTFAHAYESKANLKVKHGEAVVAGIISALVLSLRVGLLSENRFKEFIELPLKIKLPPGFKIGEFKSIINYMYRDKKNREEEIKFILLSDIGKIITDAKVEEDDIYYALGKTESLIKKNKF